MHRGLITDRKGHQFALMYKQLVIGKLLIYQGEYTFQYSDEFRLQSSLSTIADFPRLDKIYKSSSLWPFFLSRIPSINTPSVSDRIKKHHIDYKNKAEMLRFFGRRSINNPFVLEEMC